MPLFSSPETGKIGRSKLLTARVVGITQPPFPSSVVVFFSVAFCRLVKWTFASSAMFYAHLRHVDHTPDICLLSVGRPTKLPSCFERPSGKRLFLSSSIRPRKCIVKSSKKEEKKVFRSARQWPPAHSCVSQTRSSR